MGTEELIIGIGTAIIIEIGAIVRSIISSSKAKKRTETLTAEVTKIKEENAEILNKNEADHKRFFKALAIIQEQLEHSSYIPTFEVRINSYLNRALKAHDFNNEDIKNVALSTCSSSVVIFTNILKVGFKEFEKNSPNSIFNLQELKIETLIESLDININKKELFDLLSVAKKSFIFELKEAITTKTNGKRQEAFEKLCQSYISSIISKLSIF